MKQYTREEVARHNSAASCWLIVDSRVYDVTAFLDSHPGGAQRLLSVAGKDATDSFLSQHNDSILRQKAIQYEIGSIQGEKSVDSVPPFPEEEAHEVADKGREDSFTGLSVDDPDDRVSIISVHSNLPDAAPAPDDSEEMSFENLRSMMPYGIPDAALHEETNCLNKAGILQFGHLSLFTLEELEKIVKPATARALRHYLKGSVRPPSLSSPVSTNRHNSQADLTVGFLRPLLGGVPDLALEEEVAKLRSKGILTAGALSQFSMEDLEKIVRPATVKALKPYLKSTQLGVPGATHVVEERPLTIALLRKESQGLGLSDLVIEQEFAKLTQAGIVNLSQLAQRNPEELSALVKPEVLRALAKYFKGGDRQINMEPRRLRASNSLDPSEQPLDVAYLKPLLVGASDIAIEGEVAALRNAGLLKVGDLASRTADDLDKIVKLGTSKALRQFTKDGRQSNGTRPSLTGSRPVVAATVSQEINLSFLRSVLLGVPDGALESEIEKLKNASIFTLGDTDRLSLQDLQKIVHVTTARALKALKRDPTPGRELNVVFLAGLMPGVPDGALMQEVSKLHTQQITSVEHLERYTVEDLEKFGLRAAAAKALRVYTKGGLPNAGIAGLISPPLAARTGNAVPAIALDTWAPSSELTMAFLRSAMPGVPEPPLQEELNKLRNNRIVTVGHLATYTVEDMEKIVRSSTARAMARFLKPAPGPKGVLSPALGAQASGGAIPSLALNSVMPKGVLSPVMRGAVPGEPLPPLLLASIFPHTEITTSFLRQLLPESHSSSVHDEVLKLQSRNINTVGLLSNYSLQEMERIVLPLTARALSTFLKQAPQKAVVSPTLGTRGGLDSVPQFNLEAKLPSWTEISVGFLRTVMPANMSEATLLDETAKMRQAGISTVGHLANFTAEELERVVRMTTVRAVSRYLRQPGSNPFGGLLSPEQKAAQFSQPIPAFQLDRLKNESDNTELSLTFIRSLMPGVPDAPLLEELTKLQNRNIRTVGHLSFYTIQDLQFLRPGTSRALSRFLKPAGGPVPSPLMGGQQPMINMPSMTLNRPPPPPLVVDPSQELNVSFLRTLLPAGVPDAALQDELSKLRDNFVLTVGHLADYSPEDLEKMSLKIGTIRALKVYVKGGTAVTVSDLPQAAENEDKVDGELTPQFLASVMPKGVPESALHAELGKLKSQLVSTLYHVSLLTLEDMEKIVRLTTARSLRDYLQGGRIQVPAPKRPVVEIPLPPELPDGPPWTDKHAINVAFLRGLMPPGLPDEPLKEEIVKLRSNKIVTVGDLGKLTTEEITKLAGMSGWFLKDYAKEGPKCVYVPPPPYVPDPEITLAFMKDLMPPGIPENLIQDELTKLTAAKIITVPDLGEKTPDEMSKIVGMSGWFLKDYLKGGSKLLAPNPKPVSEQPIFTEGPEQELSGPFLKSIMPLGIPDDAFEEESKKFRAAGINNLGQLGQFTARELDGTVRILTLRSLGRFLRSHTVSPTLKQSSPQSRNMDDEITVSFLRVVMPAGVPTSALQEEVGKLHARGIWTIGNLSQYSLANMEQIVRATTARSLKDYLNQPDRKLSVAVAPPSPIMNGPEEISVGFLRTVMPAGVPETALQEEVGKLKARGLNTVDQLGTKTLAEMETIVRLTTARSLKDYLKSPTPVPSPQASPNMLPVIHTQQTLGMPVDWTREEISLPFLRAMMPGVPDGPLLEELNHLRNKAILRVNQLKQFTDYELGQIVRAATVRALKNYIRGGSAVQTLEIGPNTELGLVAFRTLIPGVPEGPLQEEISKLRSRGINVFGQLQQYTLEEISGIVKPGIARALARFLKASSFNAATSLEPGAPSSLNVELNLAYFRSAMPGVPDAPLLAEVAKLQGRSLTTLPSLSSVTLAELEQLGLRPATLRALQPHVKQP